MKKIITTIISMIFVISSCTSVFAMKTVNTSFQTWDSEDIKHIERTKVVFEDGYSRGFYPFEIAGVEYIYQGSYTQPRIYNEELEDKFRYEEYVITDNGYYTRSTSFDGAPIKMGVNMIRLYDKDFNLIKERFLNGSVSKIGYVDGLYYAKYGGHVAVSADFEEWTEIEGDIPRFNNENTIKDNMVRLNKTANFVEVSYEDRLDTKYDSMLGDWFVKYDDERNMYLTKDNVYFIKIEYDKDKHHSYSYADHFYLSYCNDNGDSIIMVDSRGNRIIIPKAELYNIMNELEEVSYVQLNDKILGFSQPPVMESDRILVPMRFLFEQMGATVDWNNGTQSAIATIGEEGQEKRVEFSIDNTTAFVNGKSETMDVPARLINDQTFVPLRFLSENLGYNVEWDDDARIAIITME